MNASSTIATESTRTVIRSSVEELISSMLVVDLNRKVETEFLPSEFGGEFYENSLKVADDGESFTVRAQSSFYLGIARQQIDAEDTVKFDRHFNFVSAYFVSPR